MSVETRSTAYVSDEVEIDLLRLAKAVVEKLWLVVAAALLCGAIVFVGSRVLVTPEYTASFTVYINNKANLEENSTISSSDVSAAKSLVETYSEIIVSQAILEKAAETAGLDLTYTELAAAVDTSTTDDTQIVKVSVTMESAENAMNFATGIANIVPDEVAAIMNGGSTQVITMPTLPTKPSNSVSLRYVAISFMLGAILMVLVICAKDLLDGCVRDKQELEERYGIPVLGAIPGPKKTVKLGALTFGA